MADNPPLPTGYYYYNGQIWSKDGGGPYSADSPDGARIIEDGAKEAANPGENERREAAEQRIRDERAAKAEADAKAQQEMAKQAEITKANNHFQYGGFDGGAKQAADRYSGLGEAAQGRKGEQIDYSRSQGLAGQAQENAAAQGRVASLMWDRATGKTPSIAGMRADQDMQRLEASQTSAAASARGPAAMALAQQGAAQNTAAGTSSISNTAQINSAQERSDAEKAAFGAYSGMRGQDFQGQHLEQDAAQKQAAINAAQREANDRFQLGMTGAEVDVNKAQLGAQGNQVGIATGAQTAANALSQQQSQHDSDRSDAWWKLGAGTAATVAGGALLHYLLPGSGSGSGSGGGGGVGGTSGGGSDVTMDNASSVNYPGESSSNGPEPPHIDSDERLKESMTREGAPSNRVDAFLDGIHPLSYNYKSAASEPRSVPTGGKYLGISAQDLEAVPEVGKQMVSEGPRGKQIESGPTLSAALAGLARLHERVKGLEGGGERSETRAKGGETIVPLYEEPGTERHYDRDVSTAQASRADGGASLSGPAPKYSIAATPPPAPARAAAHAAPRKMTVEELMRAAQEMKSRNEAQRSIVDAGASVSPAPPAWLRHEMEPQSIAAFTSDIRAKGNIQSEGNPSLARAWALANGGQR